MFFENCDVEWETEDEELFSLSVQFYYHPRVSGKRERGLQMEPDEPSSIEVINIKLPDGTDPSTKIPFWSEAAAIEKLEDEILTSYEENN